MHVEIHLSFREIELWKEKHKTVWRKQAMFSSYQTVSMHV